MIIYIYRVKSNEYEDRFEEMKVTLIATASKSQKFEIQITHPNDPLFLYALELSEMEFHQLKSDQSLLIDFQNFTPFLQNMIEQCITDNNFTCILHKRNATEALFVIQERTKFKEVNHLVLNVTQADDSTLKRYLGALSSEFKSKFEDTEKALNSLSENYDMLCKENSELKEQIQKEIMSKQNALNNLTNDKDKEINLIKEQCFIDSKNQLENLERTKNKMYNELEKKFSSLQSAHNDLTSQKKALDEYKTRLEITNADIESKLKIANTELTSYKENVNQLRKDNSELNQKCLQQERDLAELNYKNQSASKQNEEKDKGMNNLNQLVETLTKQREAYEDTIKSLKATNAKLEDKLQTSINEINKGNDIIQKLQGEIKNQKSKLKALKQALASQEQVTNQKQLVLDEQMRTINDLKRESETKEREISSLKTQVTNYSMKLNDNEKVIEDNKQMLMYLNKKVNDNINNPFKARTAGISNNNFDFQGSNSHNSFIGNANNFSPNIPNQFTSTYGQSNFIQGMPNTYQTNNYMSSTVPGNIEQQFRTSEMSRGGEQMMSGSANSSGMFIMPETNFCNYKMRGNVGSNNNMQIQQGNDSGMGDKYGMNNTAGSTMSGGLLNHKYGMNVGNNNNIHNVGELSNNSIGGGRITDNNVYEEECPRQMTHPSQQQSS